MRADVVVASNRAAAGVYADETGPLIVGFLERLGYAVGPAAVVPDGVPVGEAIEAAVGDGARVVLTTGGTGLSPTDRTPEATRAVLEFEVPGLAELMRAEGVKKNPKAALSRGLAGVRGRTLLINLPGSPKGAKESLAAVLDILPHALDTLRAEKREAPADWHQ